MFPPPDTRHEVLYQIPKDVIQLGATRGVIGLGDWPVYSHQEVVDAIDNLPQEFTEDYNRVCNSNYKIYYTMFY